MSEAFELRSADGTRLQGYRWTPEGKQKGEVLLIHGGFEHLGRYEHVGTGLAAAGYRVTGVDLRGHGKSDGRRGFVKSWNDYVCDVKAVASQIGGPHFLLAHSMGALVALDYLRDAPGVRGAVLSGPLLGVSAPIPGWKKLAASLLTRVLPTLSMANELDADGVSNDPKVVEAYRNDPLVFKTATPRWYTEMLDAIERVFEESQRFSAPLYLAWGGSDAVVSPEAIERFARRYPKSAGVETHPYPGLKHEILNEVQKDEVLAGMIAWLNLRAA